MTALFALRFKSIFKSFPDRQDGRLAVLQDITFGVADREVVAILGPSGCGKSTLLHMASGLSQPDRGEIHLFGMPIGRDTDWGRVSYMFQEDRLLPWRTALGNVELALESRKLDRQERRRRSTQALERVGLKEFLGALPNELSGGMRSRVALARSFVAQPRLLLLDEPFARLDDETRISLHSLFRELRHEVGFAALLVTHDGQEASDLSDKIITMTARPARLVSEQSVLNH